MTTIYVFSDHTTYPKYVGKAKNFKKRIKQHENEDRFRYDTWFYRWLNKQIRLGEAYYVDVLEVCEDNIWQEREKYWIKHLRELGYEICNMTDGGDGNNNQIFSEESNRKKSQHKIGKPLSKETRKKISDSHKGMKMSEETKKKLREINLGKPCPESVKDFLSKQIEQRDLQGNIINTFKSLTEAGKYMDCRKSTISNVLLRKKSRMYKGYIWNYLN